MKGSGLRCGQEVWCNRRRWSPATDGKNEWMTNKERIKRYLLLIAGLFVMALGIALMVKAELGTSPISSVPYVMSLKFTGISLGVFTILWNLVLIAGQAILLRGQFSLYQLLQIPISLLFGAFVDFCKWMLSTLEPAGYGMSALLLLGGCLVLALGVSCTVLAGVLMNSGEEFVNAVSIRTKKEFGTVKVVFDVSLVLLSVLLSLLFFGSVQGVREGTVVAAVISGFIIKGLNRLFRPAAERWFQSGEKAPAGDLAKEGE